MTQTAPDFQRGQAPWNSPDSPVSDLLSWSTERLADRRSRMHTPGVLHHADLNHPGSGRRYP